MKANRLRLGMNLWPPFLFAGIRVVEISPDYRYARVRMRLRPWNRNFFGTHFGGSLFAMTDPFWVLLLFNQLGGEHVVWDQAGEIEFVAPGRGTVYAEFRLTDEHVEQVLERTGSGEKALIWFGTDVVGQDGTVIARVKKQVYARRKRDRQLAHA
jgi:acyl-coenzyme A thioesterase PaaI-like protein